MLVVITVIRLKSCAKNGASFVGMFVDLEIDYDGAYGGDSIEIKLKNGYYLSFMEEDIQEINPV